MNINVLLICDTCEKLTHCRIGISNNISQPLRFVCQTCGSSVDIHFQYKPSLKDSSITYIGASEIDDFKISEADHEISEADHFVDLHLDFPTHYDEYVMGRTPFLRAIEMIGLESMQEFTFKIQIIDERTKEADDIKEFIRLYLLQNWNLFKKSVHEYLPIAKFPCELPVDRNKCLYQLLELSFMGYIDIKENTQFVTRLSHDLANISKDYSIAFHDFINELISTDFLVSLQKDSLEIYPKILDAHLILRPAIFLDYYVPPNDDSIAMRVSNSSFAEYKDLFKDMSEILSRQLVLIAGLSNIKMRGQSNSFSGLIRGAPTSLGQFADVPFGKKCDYIDEPFWQNAISEVVDNRLRNAIAHYKTDYDEVNQIITYYPRREGLRRTRAETITFLGFSRKVLETFRIMHKLNHLIKMLYVFYYLSPSRG